MQGDVRSIKKLIAFVSIAGALAAIGFLYMQDSDSTGQVASAAPEQSESAVDDPSGTALAAVDKEQLEQAETAQEVPDAAHAMDETAAPAKADDPGYGKYVAEFKDAFAESDPCRYVGIINKLNITSLVEVFAKEPVGQSTSPGDTEMLKRLYLQGAFADAPSASPVVSERSEEFLMALRYAGLIDGAKRTVIDYAKSEAQLRKLAEREPDNGAPLFFLSDVLASQKKDGRALMTELFKTTKFDMHWADVVRAVESQSEGSPDHYLIGSLIMYSLPFPEITAPRARIIVWIEDSDDEVARRALAWAGPLAEELRRSAPTLGGGTKSLREVEYTTFRSIANAARKKLKLPLDQKPFSSKPTAAKDEFGEHSWSAFEDLEGRKYDDERSASPPPCDRRTMDRHYQRYMTREWRGEQRH